MSKIVAVFATFSLLAFTAPGASAQMMGKSPAAGGDDHTAREEAEGKAVWAKLQAKQVTCADLSEDDFGTLGEFFMGERMGAAHAAVNERMAQMMGKAGEEQMHVAMGKRLSGCDQAAPFPSQGTGFMPMMQMMMGAGITGARFGGGMMGASSSGGMMGSGSWPSNSVPFPRGPAKMGYGFAPFGGVTGSLFVFLWWVLFIAGVVALIRLLLAPRRGSGGGGSALEILKQRYARGEMGKQEFEEKRKDLA